MSREENRDVVYQEKRRWRWDIPRRENEEEHVDCSVYVMDYIRTVY